MTLAKVFHALLGANCNRIKVRFTHWLRVLVSVHPCDNVQCINGGEPEHIGDVCECFCVGGYTGSSCEGIAALNHVWCKQGMFNFLLCSCISSDPFFVQCLPVPPLNARMMALQSRILLVHVDAAASMASLVPTVKVGAASKKCLTALVGCIL